MKFAFLVLCHKNPEQINLLLQKLELFDCDIYLHIDKKRYKEIIMLLNKKSNIHIIDYENSYDVKWGGIEMIQATLDLIDLIQNSKVKYDYLWLLSGQDYIIKNPNLIINEMSNNLDNDYIEIIDKNNSSYQRYKKLYDVYYWNWMTKDKIVFKIIKRLYMIFTGGFVHTFNIFLRKKPFEFDFYFGSQWWTLKSSVAYQILEYSKKHPDIIEYYKHSIIPDECFFQTIYMHLFNNNNRKGNLTFVNWKGKSRSPDIIKSDDINVLLEKNNYYFARKFDINIDKDIIKLIDNNIEA